MDKCLKKYFKFNNDSCWIDSLFVALFHNSSSLIKNFVTNLKLNYVINKSLEEINLGTKIIDKIKNKYNYLNSDKTDLIHNTNKSFQYLVTEPYIHETNNNIRKLLNEHLKLIQTSNKINPNDNSFYDDFCKSNNSMDLLKYLFYYIFDTNSSNNITCYSWKYDDYINNNYNQLRNYFTNENINLPEYKNINFIHFIHNMEKYSDLKNYKLKELNNLFLHSIIAYDAKHYICYYKCNNKWYKYDDLGIEEYREEGKLVFRTKLIGELEDIMKDYHDIIEKEYKKEYKKYRLQLTLLYLKNEPNKIQKLKELIDNHFDRLKNL